MLIFFVFKLPNFQLFNLNLKLFSGKINKKFEQRRSEDLPKIYLWMLKIFTLCGFSRGWEYCTSFRYFTGCVSCSFISSCVGCVVLQKSHRLCYCFRVQCVVFFPGSQDFSGYRQQHLLQVGIYLGDFGKNIG